MRPNSKILLAALSCSFLAVTSIYAAGRSKSAEKGTADREKISNREFSPAAVNDAEFETAGPDSRGPLTVKVQILLDRAHFSPGEIDGIYGANTKVAVRAYQSAHNFDASGKVDRATWNSLIQDPVSVLTPYTTTQDDVAGPFQPTPESIEEQAKLDKLTYQSASEKLGEKFHISPGLLQKLNPHADFTLAHQSLMVPNVRNNAPKGTVDHIVVKKSTTNVLALNAAGRVIAAYPATIGSEHDPLPIGDWKITIVKQDPIFYYHPTLFWDSNPSDSKAKIAPGPNNPVGVVWIGLSKEHYGIHGTPEPSLIGHSESHGCIRLTNWDAEELSHLVKPGMAALLEE